nr:flagellar assembly protein FliX [uncultured Brevundimonas sp.]
MKVVGTGGPNAATGSRGPRGDASGFSLGQTSGAAAPAAAASAAATSSVTGVSALMALQEVEGPLERRRRAVRRGGGLLDRLDELKMALLSGESGGPALERLARVLREERPDDGDVELTALLDQIDLRAQVELAKAEPRNARG